MKVDHKLLARNKGSSIFCNIVSFQKINLDAADHTDRNTIPGLGAYQQGEKVRMLTIDSLDLQHCDFMKIAIEGMERDVLKSVRKTICYLSGFRY